MIKDKTLKGLATFLTRLNCSTITTLNQVNEKGEKEKSLYVMFFFFNKKISFDMIFGNRSFKIERG